jgi:hypothetical protein
LDLTVTADQKHQMMLTVEEYRRYLRPLVLIVNAQWIMIADLTSKERINAVEKMIHQTADNPSPKHEYFQACVNKYPSIRNFPSYLRRTAIADAIGTLMVAVKLEEVRLTTLLPSSKMANTIMPLSRLHTISELDIGMQ